MLTNSGKKPILRSGVIVAGLAFVAMMPLESTFAAGSGGSSDSASCPKGQAYNQSTGKCVKASLEVLPDEELTDYAFVLVEEGRYGDALEILDLLQNPETPKALNYRGYITRKLGKLDEGIAYYLKSVSMDPEYAQVREYLGEAYVIKGRLDLADEQLQKIKSICGTGCEEYKQLAAVIANPSSW